MNTIKFPEDNASTGGFQTLLMFSTWAQKGTIKQSSGECGNESLTANPESLIFLPMPENVGTGYHGIFDDVEGIDYMRDDINASSGFGGAAANLVRGNVFTASTQIQRLINGTVAGTGSAAMSQNKILNNKAGMEYKGASLREHQLTWKLTPRNSDEQESITKIISYIKAAATPAQASFGPAMKGWLDTFEKQDNDNKDVEGYTNTGLDWNDVGEESVKLAGTVTTLSIPPTVSVKYLNHGVDNKQLFKIADSFITSFDINYTPNGHWQSNMDGSAMETTISITLKEISAITAEKIREGF